MKELLYIEIPTPEATAVKSWLKEQFQPCYGHKLIALDGIRLVEEIEPTRSEAKADQPLTLANSVNFDANLSVFIWSLQRTTYLKAFRWGDRPLKQETAVLRQLQSDLRQQFPICHPPLPELDLSEQSIFEAIAPYYPKTAQYFQAIPNGESDLHRVYWWEKRWREGVSQPQQPRQVLIQHPEPVGDLDQSGPIYDLIYIGGALGVIHAAVMARLGYRVLLIERLAFGRMNREWNISRDEFQRLIDLNLFTPAEFEAVIACEYVDGFHKFFDANNPPQAKAPVLHTPTVLNIALDAEALLRICGEKLRAAGGQIWDETEFTQLEIWSDCAQVKAIHLSTQQPRQAKGRLVVDAMGTASPIAQQLNGGRAFDSVCPTVGAVISGGFDPAVWDSQYGDVLNSHGDISRGRQLIWELFPGRDQELTIYLFHYHQVHPENPGSLLEMYEDFFTILPEYRRCDLDRLKWRKATFGYIPGYFSTSSHDRQVASDRLIAIGDAASLQSPLVFTGFGSLVRNLNRLTNLLDTALRHDLLSHTHLNRIRAHQSNVAVTWLFSKGMMVPTAMQLPPQRINTILNTFFGILGEEKFTITDNFIKDRIDWLSFNRMALKAAFRNPSLLLWIWELAGAQDCLRWLGSYLDFTFYALISALLGSWLPKLAQWLRPWLEPRFPSTWLWLLSLCYIYSRNVEVFAKRPIAAARSFSPALGRELKDKC